MHHQATHPLWRPKNKARQDHADENPGWRSRLYTPTRVLRSRGRDTGAKSAETPGCEGPLLSHWHGKRSLASSLDAQSPIANVESRYTAARRFESTVSCAKWRPLCRRHGRKQGQGDQERQGLGLELRLGLGKQESSPPTRSSQKAASSNTKFVKVGTGY